MPTKLILIFSLFLFGITNQTLAQEKQNDATWEETVGFLKEYIPRFDRKHGKYKIIENEIRYNPELLPYVSRANLNYILNAKLVKEDTYEVIHLDFEVNAVKDTYDDGTDYHDSFPISVCSSGCQNLSESKEALAKRVLKAFQHLAYLAEEKRKQSKF